MSLWDKALQKRLDYGSSGHQAPVVPHVPRSARGKRSVRKKVEDNQMYAFDLLATVAGELLSGRENSLSPCNNAGKSNPVEARDTVKEEQTDKEKLFKFAAFDRLSCNEDILDPESVSEKNIAYNLKENPKASKASAPASPFVKSDLSDEEAIGLESKFIGDGGKSGYSVGAVDEKYGKGRLYSSYVISHECKEDGTKTRLQVEMRVGGNSLAVTDQYIYSSEDPMVLDAKSPALVSSDSSVEVSRHRSNFSHNSLFPKQEDGMDLAVNKDDDENSSGCTHPAVVTNKTSRMQHIGDRRIRKLLASKLRKVAPTTLQDGETSNYDVEQKPSLRGKRMCYTRQRTQRSSFKRRKLFDHYPVSASDGGIYSEGVSNLCDKGRIKLETNDLHANLCGVKLSIKSFKVPELVIEIPETATVGSLKRTVLEAVTSILGGGLRVGVLHQGKKVRDDNKTLRQVGITHGDKLDNLGFTLEPNPGQASTPLTSSEDPHFPGLGCAPEPLARIPPITPVVVDQGVPDATQSVQTSHESDQDSVCSPTDASSQEKTTSNSLALVAVPPMNVEALATVPFHNKPKRSESTQRRVRRPFSVAEVEALVQAVEKLGTGRWRDVKLRAFEDAKHRTYVDLKDKWKTLVHTARISPQQRRGEPVPQELLDRVLSAHAHWSQQQAKLLLKPPPSADTSLLL